MDKKFKIKYLFYLTLVTVYFNYTNAQSYSEEEQYLEPINDPSAEGQRFFVEDLLWMAGYVPQKIEIYQTLPNNARVYRVKLDSINGGFVFIRWDKNKKEHYVANKLIDPGLYYNLKAAKVIMRKQTNKASFGVDEISIQAPDQDKITTADIQELRDEFKLKEEEKKNDREKLKISRAEKSQRKVERKSKKKNKKN
jgi:hypothetical protein